MLAKMKNLINPAADASRRNGAGPLNDVFLAIVIVLVAMIGFGLGRLSKIRESKAPLSVESKTDFSESSKSVFDYQNEGIVVASKNGTKYHYPWCSGASTIKEENKVTFGSIEEARKAGYLPASNCKGLK